MVSYLKQLLSKAIGWYNSKNSKAHITICEFNADDKQEISKIKTQLTSLCYSEAPLDLHFDHIANYRSGPNGTKGSVCILPSSGSACDLITLMKRIQKNLKVRSSYKSKSPHISIARKLDDNKMATASQLLTKVDMSFYCDRIVLRVLDLKIKQYIVIDEFVFQNNPAPPDKQLTLF